MPAPGDPDAIADFDVRFWGDGPEQPERRMPADLRAMLREMALPSSDMSQDHGTPIPLDPPAGQRLDALTMPVLAITGELDESATHAVALHLAAFAPIAQTTDIPGVAHTIATEAPDEVARLVVQLLAPLGDFG